MLLNSIEFFSFFAVFFIFYWIVFSKTIRFQNLTILIGSYIFYSFWDWRFLILLFSSTLINYFIGIGIYNSQKKGKKRLLLYIGLLQGVGGLIYFKYYNFFIESFINLFSTFNITIHLNTIQIILPLGISFYTFRMLSYLLDIDKNKITPTKDWVSFFSYVAFFPCLLSGPIDRARSMLPQLNEKRLFDYSMAVDGLRQILWGMVKKIVIADQIAVATNTIFDNYETLPSSTLVLGAFYYTIQIYADFSGYSDIAIGFSKLLGIRVAKNFEFPYFAQNIAIYWRKWHMSLTSWLTEYVFTPLSINFRDWGKTGIFLAVLINFTLVGAWHGANWTFVLFGVVHGLYFIPLIISGSVNKRYKKTEKKMFPSLIELKNMIGTFILVMLANVIFRADNIVHAISYYKGIISSSILSLPKKDSIEDGTIIFLSFTLLIVEWFQRDKEYALQLDNIKMPKIIRYALYIGLIYLTIYTQVVEQDFIYFRF